MLEKIHAERNRIAQKNQAIFNKELKALNTALSQHQHKHPFSINQACRKALLHACQDYSKGAQRKELQIEVKKKFLYRYVSLNGLLNHPNWNDAVIDKANAFEILSNKVKDGNWYNLGNAMSGFYNNKRGFSWWADVFPDTMEKLYALGIPSDWIFPESAILRIDLEKNNNLSVKTPSAIDGFDSPIFHVQPIMNKIPGKTLNLNNKSNFSGGLNEYVIGAIEAKVIDLIPILFDPTHPKIRIQEIEDNLNTYYSSI